MDHLTQQRINYYEQLARQYSSMDIEHVKIPPAMLLEIFAAFRLEIIKAGGRNA